MQRRHVICDPTKCVGCGICELACSMAKEKSFNSLFSRIHSVRLRSIKEPITSIALPCMLCDDPPCVKSCPRKALSTSENGTILVREIKCNGCGLCVAACEFGAISLDPKRNVVIVCDLCKELEGPKCVEFCPKEALSFETFEEVIKKSELESSKLVMREFMNAREQSRTFYEREGFLPVKSSSISKENVRKVTEGSKK